MSTFGLELQDRQRTLLTAAYPMFAVMAINPIMGLLVTAWPLRFDRIQWRFGFSGVLVTEAMPVHAVGLALLLMVATWLGHRNVVRVVAALAVCAAVVIGVSVILFGLDALQMRRTVPQASKQQFDAAGLRTLLVSVMLVPALLWMALRSIGALKGLAARTVSSDAGLVVGRQ